MKAIRVIWLPGSITAEQRYHAAKALFESGLADWETARRAASRTPGILAASDDLSKIDEIVRRLREVEIYPQVTERDESVETRQPPASHPEVSLSEPLPERLEGALRDSLAPGEFVEMTLHYGAQALAVTNERVLLIAPAAVVAGAHWSGNRVRSFPFPLISSAELRAGWVGGQVRVTGQDSLEGHEDGMPHTEDISFLFQEERLKPLAKIMVEIIRARAKKAQHSTRTDVPKSSSRRS